MGGKQWKNRKHLLFYGACLLIVLSISAGCIIPARRVQVLPEGGTPLEQASMMVSEGDYNGALKAYGAIARSYPREYPGDRALFEMGLIWAYPDNPQKSYEEALKYFEKLLRDFRRSPLKKEADTWVDVLVRQISHNVQVRELEDKIVSCKEETNSCKKEIGSYKEEIDSCKEKINSYKDEVDSYKEQISALKEIDLGIEEKKRKVLPEE